ASSIADEFANLAEAGGTGERSCRPPAEWRCISPSVSCGVLVLSSPSVGRVGDCGEANACRWSAGPCSLALLAWHGEPLELARSATLRAPGFPIPLTLDAEARANSIALRRTSQSRAPAGVELICNGSAHERSQIRARQENE